MIARAARGGKTRDPFSLTQKVISPMLLPTKNGFYHSVLRMFWPCPPELGMIAVSIAFISGFERFPDIEKELGIKRTT